MISFLIPLAIQLNRRCFCVSGILRDSSGSDSDGRWAWEGELGRGTSDRLSEPGNLSSPVVPFVVRWDDEVRRIIGTSF